MGLRGPRRRRSRRRCSPSGRCSPSAPTSSATRYLPLLASKEGTTAAIAFTEPHAGSDLSAMRAEARRDAGRLRPQRREGLRDQRRHRRRHAPLRQARRRDHRLPARARRPWRRRPAARSGSSACAPRTPARSSSTTRASPPTACSARRAEASRSRSTSSPSRGPQVAAAAVGLARAAFEYALDYAREREAFGRPLLARQGVSFKLADAAMEIEAARLLDVARLRRRRPRARTRACSGRTRRRSRPTPRCGSTTDAVQVLGGAGIMRDHPVEKWLRDAKVFQIVEGTSEIQRQVIATARLGRARTRR